MTVYVANIILTPPSNAKTPMHIFLYFWLVKNPPAKDSAFESHLLHNYGNLPWLDQQICDEFLMPNPHKMQFDQFEGKNVAIPLNLWNNFRYEKWEYVNDI